MQITQFTDGRRPLLVVSHERSGTHFTMNAAARAFGYVSWPWFDFDRPKVNINYFAAVEMTSALDQIAEMRPANTVKSHHEFEFFREVLEKATGRFHLVYVYRNPADCLASYWRLLNTLDWNEGPRCATALEFATAAPMGRLMRYQVHQYVTMLDRWANHVRGWIAAAEGREDIHLVRYEDLENAYDRTVTALGQRIGMAALDLAPPSREAQVIKGGEVAFQPPAGADNRAAITELAVRTHPELMDRLGYRPGLARAG